MPLDYGYSLLLCLCRARHSCTVQDTRNSLAAHEDTLTPPHGNPHCLCDSLIAPDFIKPENETIHETRPSHFSAQTFVSHSLPYPTLADLRGFEWMLYPDLGLRSATGLQWESQQRTISSLQCFQPLLSLAWLCTVFQEPGDQDRSLFHLPLEVKELAGNLRVLLHAPLNQTRARSNATLARKVQMRHAEASASLRSAMLDRTLCSTFPCLCSSMENCQDLSNCRFCCLESLQLDA